MSNTQILEPLVTVAVPSYNQGCFLDSALDSILEQNVPTEVFVLDGGSTDDSVSIIQRWEQRLSGWRSGPDSGQADAINEGIAQGTAPYVCWLNSDDWILPGALGGLVGALEAYPESPVAYGRVWNVVEGKGRRQPIPVEPFDERRLARRCIISQPATLIRRSAWEAVGGLDVSLHMALDYDLWWRLYKAFGPFQFVDAYLAVNREHSATKTKTQRRLHYREAMATVKKHYGRVPWRWWYAQPYSVWFKSLCNRFERY